jgi:hypothetical protein
MAGTPSLLTGSGLACLAVAQAMRAIRLLAADSIAERGRGGKGCRWARAVRLHSRWHGSGMPGLPSRSLSGSPGNG